VGGTANESSITTRHIHSLSVNAFHAINVKPIKPSWPRLKTRLHRKDRPPDPTHWKNLKNVLSTGDVLEGERDIGIDTMASQRPHNDLAWSYNAETGWSL